MARESNQTHIDDRPELRESPVRHAHAVQAERHGRASTPGFLGLPADQDEGHGVNDELDEDRSDEESEERDESAPDENPRSRAPRARGRRRGSEDDDGEESTQSRRRPSESGGATRGRESQAGRSRSRGTTKKASGGKRASASAGGGAKASTSARRGAKAQASSSARGGAKAKASASSSSAPRAKSSGSSRSTPKAKSSGSSRSTPKAKATAARGTAKRTASAAAKPRQTKSASRPKAGGRSRSAGRKSKPGGKRSSGKSTSEGSRSAVASIKRSVSSATDSAEGAVRKRVAKEGLHLAGKLAHLGLKAGGRAAKRTAKRVLSRAGVAGADALLERAKRMPIQQSIDVAVPIAVAWEQWMEFTYFPEGARRVVDVERDGDQLYGHLDGLTSREWEAEVIDERDCESFAWRSTEGSDSAGLVTFHELAERLTRIELNLDVEPTDLAEAAGLTLRLADHRVRSELRRFKAHAELLSPDTYDELLESSNGGPPEHDGDSPDE